MAGTIADGSTYTGRPPSSANVKRGPPAKLRSTTLGWCVLRETVPSNVAAKRLPSTGPLHCRLARVERGARQSRAKSVTSGAALANAAACVPSAQRSGPRAGSAA